MDEIENNTQKPKFWGLAILQLFLIAFYWIFTGIFPIIHTYDRIARLTFKIPISLSIGVGIIILHRVHNSRRKLRDTFIAASGIVIAILLIFLYIAFY